MSWKIAPIGRGGDLLYSQAGTPSLDLRFAEKKALTDYVSGDNLVTFSRSSSATYVDSDGLIKTATTNTPRFDHDPTTGECLGLLVEEARTNYCPYSQNINTWTKLGAATTPVDGVGLDGVTTAYRVTPSVSGGYVRLDGLTSLSKPFVYTVYAKSAGYDFLYVNNDAGSGVACFNLSTGIPAFSGTGVTATMSPMGGGWYRCNAVFNVTTSGSSVRYALGAAPNSSFVSVYTINTGDGVSGVTVWGAQVEAGSFPTSYIPTTAAAATRSADVASISGSNFSSWYRQDEGTLFAHLNKIDTTNTKFVVGFGYDGNNYIALGYQSTQFLAARPLLNGLVTTGGFPSITNVSRKAAVSYSSTGASCYLDSIYSSTPASVAGVPVGASGTLYLGTSPFAPSIYAVSHFSRLTYWPQRLPDTTLQTITT